MGANHFAAWPTAVYGMILLLSAVAYYILQELILHEQGEESKLARAYRNRLKEWVSVLLYAIAIPVAFFNQWISDGLYVVVALLWLVPDRRIEKRISV